MQPTTDPPRDHLTADQVEQLLTWPKRQIVHAGLELLDVDDVFVEDISTVLSPAGSSIARDAAGIIHGSCQLELSEELAWGRDRVKPYLILAGPPGLEARFDLGVYVLQTPQRQGGRVPPRIPVSGQDKLQLLDQSPARTITVAKNAPIIAAVTDLLAEAGQTNVWLSGAGDDVNAPARFTRVLDEQVTWLSVINELLAMAGWDPLWADWNGVLRSQPARLLTDRGPERSYSTVVATSIMSPTGVLTDDKWKIPNRWVVFASSAGLSSPTVGNGIHVVDDEDDQALRGIVTATRRVEAASQSVLEQRAEQLAAEETRHARRYEVDVLPVPIHWHNDVVDATDPALEAAGSWSVVRWTLPLHRALMHLELEAIL